jgi:hypothetical protein
MSPKARTKFGFVPKRRVSVARLAPERSTTCVTRKVTIDAPPQTVDGKLKRIVVTALPLPTTPPPQPPSEKNIRRIISWVVDPLVQVEETGEIRYEFDQPLTVTVEFTAADAKAASPDQVTGKPRLFIFTCHKDEKGWHWEKLDTTVTVTKTTGGGTLMARIANLHPNDPVGEGSD